MAASYSEASPTNRQLHVRPSFPAALLGGPRDPPSLRAASAQSRVGGGEEPYRGPLAGRVPSAGHAEEALRGAAQLQRPQSWVLRVFSVVKPTSRSLPLPARPSSPGTAREKLKGPTPPSCVPRTVLIPVPPATPHVSPLPLPRRLCCAQTCPGAKGRAPGLPGAGGAADTVWFELGSTERALWPWPLHPFGSPAEARPLRWPARQPRERVTPGAATGRRTQTHVESFYLTGSLEPVKAPLCGTPQPLPRAVGLARHPRTVEGIGRGVLI